MWQLVAGWAGSGALGDVAADWTADVVVDKLAPWPNGALGDAGCDNSVDVCLSGWIVVEDLKLWMVKGYILFSSVSN